MKEMKSKFLRITSWRPRSKALFIAILVVAAFSAGGVAYADYSDPVCTSTVIWGRKDCDNYISGNARSGNIPPFNNNFFVNKTDYAASFDQNTFKSTVEGRLKSGDTEDAVSATVLIDIMLGKPGADFKGNRALATAYATSHQKEWEKLVDDYDKKGLVKWDVTYCPAGNYENSSYDDANDDVWHFTQTSDCIRTIRFDLPDGKSGEPFRIQYGCGNPVGEAGLPAAAVPPQSDINPPTAPGNNPPGYATGDSAVNSSCQVISGHAFDPATPTVAMKVTVSFSTGGPPIAADASTSGSHLFSIDTPDSVRTSLTAVTVTATVTNAAGDSFPIDGSPITVGPCAVLTGSCVNAAASPGAPDPNSSYSIRATLQYGSSVDATVAMGQPDFKFYVHITGPNGPTVIYDNKNVTPVTRSGNQLAVQIDNLPPAGKSGTYEISWGTTGTYGAVQCGYDSPGRVHRAEFTALNKPYFNVHGGDVSVGSAMSPGVGDTCSVKKDDSASVVGWSQDPANDNYGGAGTQYAAFALNHIQEFATAQGSGALPTEPSGLSFANSGLAPGTVNAPSGLYGGKFGGSSCVTNYFANATAANTTNGPVVLSTLTNFPGSGNIPNGSRMVYYINGDLLIDSDVRFSGNYGNTAAIPTFAVVVKGNILIAPGVQQLDGFYIAQASSNVSTNGVIFTCAPAGFNTNAANVLNKDLQASCDNSLTVNGSFLARQIWPLRTSGNVSTTPAEIFNYVPELWLTAPFGSGLSTNYSDYDAISSLPPVL
jgi:hypothetical protein